MWVAMLKSLGWTIPIEISIPVWCDFKPLSVPSKFAFSWEFCKPKKPILAFLKSSTANNPNFPRLRQPVLFLDFPGFLKGDHPTNGFSINLLIQIDNIR